HLDQIVLDTTGGTPLHRQIYREVRRAILGGRLRPGARVPSTRVVAEQLGVARSTVARSFGALLREGYLVGRLGRRPYGQGTARHLPASRALVSRPEHVAIVNGTQQAIDLLARLLVSPGDRVAVEDPGYPEARRVLAAYGAEIEPIPVDGRGLRADALPEG